MKYYVTSPVSGKGVNEELTGCVLVSKESNQHPLSFSVETSQSLLQYQQSCEQLFTFTGTSLKDTEYHILKHITKSVAP